MKNEEWNPILRLLAWMAGLGLAVVAIEQLWPDYIPFGLFDLWRMPNMDLLWIAMKPLAIAGLVFAVAGVVFSFWRRSRTTDEVLMSPSQALLRGVVVTIVLAVVQEVLFRWLMFYLQIAAYQLLNGFFGVPEWIHANVMTGAANLLIGDSFEAYFSGEYFGLWAVGAAMITSSFWWNGTSRSCIKLVSPLNWYVGVYMMLITLTLGLPTAMLVRLPFGLILVLGNFVQANIMKARKVV